MWPLIYKKKSVVAVGGMSSGKSVGYLVPLVRMISSYPDYPRPVNQSPLAVVLCPSWRDVVAVEGWFKDLSKGLTVPGEKDNRVETGSEYRIKYITKPPIKTSHHIHVLKKICDGEYSF